jgi:hypothetical protein
LNADRRAKERFLVEARAAAALDHPNICNIYEVGEADTRRSFMAMAYYGGATVEKPGSSAATFAVPVANRHPRGCRLRALSLRACRRWLVVYDRGKGRSCVRVFCKGCQLICTRAPQHAGGLYGEWYGGRSNERGTASLAVAGE